jgi:hypothetical protein
MSVVASSFVRVIVQQCESAELLIDNVDKYTQIGNGIIVMCSFLKRAEPVSADELAQMVQKILAAKIHTVPGTPLKSAFGVPVGSSDAADAPAPAVIKHQFRTKYTRV